MQFLKAPVYTYEVPIPENVLENLIEQIVEKDPAYKSLQTQHRRVFEEIHRCSPSENHPTTTYSLTMSESPVCVALLRAAESIVSLNGSGPHGMLLPIF